MKPVVGILVDPQVIRRIKVIRSGHEQISLYNQAARKLGLTPFYMTLERVRAKTASGYLYNNGEYKATERAIPGTIHNRTFARTSLLKKRLRILRRNSKVFNRDNSHNKFRINRMLTGNKTLRANMPKTVRFSKSNLIQAMRRHQGLFIKPVHGSVGDGIIKLTKLREKWSVQWAQNKSRPYTPNGARAAVRNKIKGRKYLIQETIPLAQYKGRPYDLRVSVQRSYNGKWQITGIVGRVTAKGGHVTNVAKGGKVVKCEVLLRSSGFDVSYLKRSISRVSLDIANYLGRRIPQLADIGLDIGVDRNGGIKFIEMNGRDQRYAFKKAGMSNTFYKSYETPLKYAKYLMHLKK